MWSHSQIKIEFGTQEKNPAHTYQDCPSPTDFSCIWRSFTSFFCFISQQPFCMHLLKAVLRVCPLPYTQTTSLPLLSSLSCTLNLQNSAKEEEISDLDFCDLVSESMATQKIKKGSKMDVECIPHPDISIDKLKEILISISSDSTRNSSMENITMSMHVFFAQVMLLVEELHIRDTVSVQAKPHLVHLTNYGLYVCRNAKDEYYSPSVAAPSDLRVKKWCILI